MGNIEIKKIGTPSNNATTMRHPKPPLRALVLSSDSASRTSVLSDAVYPALLTVSMICSSVISAGTITRADSSGRFTAGSTPGILRSLRSTRPTQDAHVMP